MRPNSLFFVTSFVLTAFSLLYSQELSPQAKAVLNRLPPEQRALALQEANRHSSKVSSNDFGKPTNQASEETQNANLEAIDEKETQNNIQDEIFMLKELEFFIREDLTLEKKNFEQARLELDDLDFLKIERGFNDRVYDLQKLLDEIKSAKISSLQEQISVIREGKKAKLRAFGYNFFNDSIQSAVEGGSASIPSNYMIGPGDYLEIQMFGLENDGFTLMIGRNGIIQFPGIGPINVFENGGSFQNLKNLLKEKVRENLGEGVQISISMGEVRLIKIFLAGEFSRPGLRLLPATSTLMEALLYSGGLTNYGSLRNVTIKRKGDSKKVYDFYSLLLDGDNPSTDSLLDGDVVFLPRVQRRVMIDGEIVLPAIFEFKDPTSLEDVVKLAGGFTSEAYPSDIRLVRVDAFGNKLLRSLSYSSDGDFKIRDGDSIEVGLSTELKKNTIKLEGEVDRKGEYEWREGLRLLDIVKSKSLLSDNADLNYALIRRIKLDGKVEILSFSPSELWSGITKSNIILEPKDTVFVFAKFDSKSRERLIRPLLQELSYAAEPAVGSRVVSVIGEVHFPGDYPLTSGMTIEDLVLAAGGLKESAFSLSAEISRVIVDFNQTEVEATVKHLMVKSLYDSVSLMKVLSPGDVLSVKTIPSWLEDRLVTISGEVRFPGDYTVRKSETIGQVISRAGGITKDAFVTGAIFTRAKLIEKEESQKEKLIERLESDIATLSLSPTSGETAQKANSVANSLLLRLRNSKSAGRLVIDLGEQLTNPEKSQLIVRHGDKIHIPNVPSEVSVMGEVQFATSHLYKADLTVDEFINLSGGFTQNADEKRIFVVKSNGAVFTKNGNGWFSGQSREKKIQAGDVIVVPINLQKGKWLETLTSSTQIVYQLAVTAAAVNSF